ncbi:MAG: NHL repeat-containing protein [Desulfobulbaceae bacterium]|nr:NHL repeat-containing protein [Desulfobulbaceae bacterium]
MTILLFIGVLFYNCLALPVTVLAQEQEQIPFKVVSMITRDDLGDPLGSPSGVMFDPAMDETYILVSGKIVVYGPDFYPFVALGKGRGAESTQGMAIDRNGMLYIGQVPSDGKPARITIFNAAFFPVRDIFFKGFPHADLFVPRAIAVSQDGLIYVAATMIPGVVVMDQQGEVLRWLKPKGRYVAQRVIRDDEVVAGEEDPKSEGRVESEASGEAGNTELLPDDPFAGLPADLIPKKKEVQAVKKVRGLQPLTLVDIEIDQEGHLYLLSESEGKVFVYSANEEFLYSFGIKGGSSGKLSRPRGLAIDENKKCIYVIDFMRQSLVIYDLAGKYIFDFGGSGWGPGWFSYPTDIALNRKGDVIITDFYNKRVQVLNLQFESRFPLFGSQSEFPADLEKNTSLPVAEQQAEAVDDVKSAGEGSSEQQAAQPAALQEQDDSGAGVAGVAEELPPPSPETPPALETLPEPISPPSEGAVESLSATGDNSPDVDDPLFGVNPEGGIAEEPIGALPYDAQ